MGSGIVVGVDPSAAGGSALRWALRDACVRQLPVTAVRAWMPSAVFGYGAAGMLMSGGDALEAETLAAEQLALAREAVAGSGALTTRSEAVLGSPAEVLLARTDAELLVVGTRGAGTLSRLVLGSVSSAVLHHATTVVVVVPELPEPVGPPERVLVGYDHSASALAAVRFAADHARRHGAALVPVHVREQLWVEGAAGDRVEDPLAARQLLQDPSLRAALDTAGLDLDDVHPQVVPGQAADRLTSMVTPRDVLVLGARGQRGFARLLLGSTSTQCAQHAVCPVVVVRARP